MAEGNSKFRLLLVTGDKYPPYRVDSAVLFGKELKGRGQTVDWLLQSEAHCAAPYSTLWMGCNMWVGPNDLRETFGGRLRKHLLDFINDFRVFRLIRARQYDFVQVKDKPISALLALLAARLNGVRFLYWMSFPITEGLILAAKEGTARYPLLNFVRGMVGRFLLYRIILPCARHVFVQSDQMRADVAAMGIPPGKITPVPMGISIDSFPECAVSHSVGDSDATLDIKHIVYLGTLSKLRKLDFLLRVFALVREQMPGTMLDLVGGGGDSSDQAFLEQEAQALGIREHVLFTGFLPMEEAWAYVKKADVCVSPFYPTYILNSTSPTKLIEYMALCKPVVANDHPEQSLVIRESGAGICVPYEEGAFASAIVMLLRNRDMAADMGRKGRAYVEANRTYKVIGDIVEDAYLMLLRTSGSAARLPGHPGTEQSRI
jgi:glycosyltransferase involved in cell wall biosynthesis